MMVEFLYLHLKKEKEKEIITSAEYIAFGTGITQETLSPKSNDKTNGLKALQNGEVEVVKFSQN